MRNVVHFEIPADDLERAKDFYASVFGWEDRSTPMGEGEYTLPSSRRRIVEGSSARG